MTILGSLEPGDIVDLNGPTGLEWGVFVSFVLPHPIRPRFALVIWRLQDGRYSFDCLSLVQDIGQARQISEDERRKALEWALGHHGAEAPSASG